MFFLFPPLQSVDEKAHFLQSYQLVNNYLFPEKRIINGEIKYGTDVPNDILIAAENFLNPVALNIEKKFDTKLYSQYINQEIDEHNTTFIFTTIYPPIPYVPQALGIKLAKSLGLSILHMIWFGRIFCWVIIIFLAVKLMPIGKWATVFLALNPVALSLAASLSADATSISLIALFISLCLFLRKRQVRFINLFKILIIILAVLITLTKPVNFLFILLAFLIPINKFKNNFSHFIFCVSIVLISFICLIFWWDETRHIYHAEMPYIKTGVVPREQLVNILQAPGVYFHNILTTFVTNLDPGSYGDFFFLSYFGIFGWHDTSIPIWTIFLYVTRLTLSLLRTSDEELKDFILTPCHKIFSLLIMLSVALATITALYIYWTPLGSKIIEGVQGRYMIPATFLSPIIVARRKDILLPTNVGGAIVLSIIVAIVLSMTTLRVYYRYY